MFKLFALLAFIIGISSCDSPNTSPTTTDSNVQDSPKGISGNCIFLGQSLYESYELLTIDHDTISIFQNGEVDKIVISGNYKIVKARRRYTEGILDSLRKDKNQNIFELNNIPPPIQYSQVSKEIKKQIQNKGFNPNLKKIQQHQNTFYFFCTDKHVNFTQHFYKYDSLTGRIDTLGWIGHTSQSQILGFVLWDFLSDGYIELVVFSECKDHIDCYGVDCITTSPNCKNGNDQKQAIASEIHPNDLFFNNCAMCHPYNQRGATAPPIVSYSVDSVLNYYDGKSTKDSVWQMHKKIQLIRKEWERIAIQMQPGDVFPK
jgi:hypothetical protein